jgi:CBS domain-containing protein
MSVNTLMTKEVISVRATDRVNDAWVLLMETGITEAPVVDDSGNLVGVLTTKEISRSIIERYLKARSLSQLTTHQTDQIDHTTMEKEEIRELTLAIRGVVESAVSSLLPKDKKWLSIGADDSIERAIRTMAENSVNMLPVLKDSHVVGVLTRQDIIWLIAGRPGKTHW